MSNTKNTATTKIIALALTILTVFGIFATFPAMTAAAAAAGPGTYKVTTPSGLYVRSGAGTNYSIVGGINYGATFVVTQVNGSWGYVPSHGGWSCLDYAQLQSTNSNIKLELGATGIFTAAQVGIIYDKVFSPVTYAASFSDLKNAFGDGKTADSATTLWNHFWRCGLSGAEPGRLAGFSPVFKPDYYLAHNLDVAKAFNANLYKGLQHFADNGMREGRKSHPEFSVHDYKNRYTDLQNAYGNAMDMYYRHYVKWGLSEGRNAKPGGSAPVNPPASNPITDKLDALINGTALLRYNGSTQSAQAGTRWNDWQSGAWGWQCKGFATAVFYELYGYNIAACYFSARRHVLEISTARTTELFSEYRSTRDRMISLLKSTHPGDYIQMSKSSSQHSMIVYSVESNGLWIYDANSDGNNTIKKQFRDWDYFYNYMGSSSYGISAYRTK